ncbi:hypothetical protein B0H15DRAFT_950986 [Mycena belliarum]|uniref:Myb/SANT-like domain-containing protein n=1 Tax=Mycena belliarum TaxID=1033014 RepID=A0AAD6U154_9AGAR|nr:hypothetical protein B0H15DRAFT_950986 [Mycena belliae]
MAGSKKNKDKENQNPSTTTMGGAKAKRCRWSTTSDGILITQLLAEKAAGNQTDNAGWHQAAWTACARKLAGSENESGGAAKSSEACLTRWSTLKTQYQLVKMLREKSGWGWDDEAKHIVVEDSVWEAYLAINDKIRKWCYRGFPFFDEMADLVDGAVATGAGAFQPGQQDTEPVAAAPSPPWPSQLPEDDEDSNFPLDPALKGAGGRFEALPGSPGSQAGDDAPNSDMDEVQIIPTPAPRKRTRAISDSPPSTGKRRRTDGHGHGRKPSNGHALMAVSESLNGIAAAFKADSGPTSPVRKTNALKIMAAMPMFFKEEKSHIARLIRADTGVADAFMALHEVDAELGVDYLRSEMNESSI